jgi:site-specific DNA-methyltransferase (adenine-specific)
MKLLPRIKPETNTIFRGDNLEIMKVLPDEFVDLCYVDPPFFTQKDYVNIWGDKESVFDYEDVPFNGFRDTKDFFEKHVSNGAKGLHAYLTWMRARLEEIFRILKKDSSFYCHLDYHAIHYVKVMLDEIFGYKNFRGEIIWQRKLACNSVGEARSWPNSHDIILFYTKGKNYFFEQQFIDDSKDLPESIKNAYRKDDKDGRGLYQHVSMEAISDSPSLKFKFKGFDPPKRGWKWNKERMEEEHKKGNIYVPVDKSKRVRQKLYLKDRRGNPISGIWTDINCVQGGSKEFVGWKTQKPIALLERIISASSKEGDLIFDCFAGCGTSMHAAHNLKRKWMGVDISPTAIKVNQKRLTEIGAKVKVVDENDLIDMKRAS